MNCFPRSPLLGTLKYFSAKIGINRHFLPLVFFLFPLFLLFDSLDVGCSRIRGKRTKRKLFFFSPFLSPPNVFFFFYFFLAFCCFPFRWPFHFDQQQTLTLYLLTHLLKVNSIAQVNQLISCMFTWQGIQWTHLLTPLLLYDADEDENAALEINVIEQSTTVNVFI